MNFQDMSNLGSIFTCFLLKSSKGVDNCRFQVFGGCWGNASYLAVMSVHLFSFWHLPIGVDNCWFQVFGGCWGNASHPVVMSVQQKNEFVEGIHLFQWQCQLRERMDLKFCKLVRLSVESFPFGMFAICLNSCRLWVSVECIPSGSDFNSRQSAIWSPNCRDSF